MDKYRIEESTKAEFLVKNVALYLRLEVNTLSHADKIKEAFVGCGIRFAHPKKLVRIQKSCQAHA